MATLAGLAACAGCAGQSADTTAAGTTTSTTATSSTSTPVTTTTTTATPKPKPTTKKPTPPRTTTTTHRPAPVVPSSRPPSPTPRTTPTHAGPATCSVPQGVTAPQVVVVVGSGSSATVRACARSGGRYVLQRGPFYGHVGKNGVSWNKHEGDNTTPGGTYALVEGFGNYSNPGLRVGSWLRVDSKDVWVEDPSSALYNTHQRLPSTDASATPSR